MWPRMSETCASGVLVDRCAALTRWAARENVADVLYKKGVNLGFAPKARLSTPGETLGIRRHLRPACICCAQCRFLLRTTRGWVRARGVALSHCGAVARPLDDPGSQPASVTRTTVSADFDCCHRPAVPKFQITLQSSVAGPLLCLFAKEPVLSNDQRGMSE